MEKKKKDFETLLNERENKCRKLFKEMLEYKNKEYDENLDIVELIGKVIQYYTFYAGELRVLKQALIGNTIQFDIDGDLVEVNDNGRLVLIDKYYNLIVNEDYKKVAYMYKDFELKDGQTYDDLYDIEYEKLDNLYRKMLEFLGEKDLENEKNIEGKMLEKYPFYLLDIKRINTYEPYSTVIERLNIMENVYEKLSRDYKNYEENMKKYKEFQEGIYEDVVEEIEE